MSSVWLLLSVLSWGEIAGGGPFGPWRRPIGGRYLKIQHVVIVVQENRTPDNLFHGLPNADIADSGVNSRGETIRLAPMSLAAGYDFGRRRVRKPRSCS